MTHRCEWPDGSVSGATFSDDERHRYFLWRTLPEARSDNYEGTRPKFVTFLMLNPSTATHEVSDPTITRCAGFTRTWGYTSFQVVNLFSFRATKPRVLRDTADAEGDPQNMNIIRYSVQESDVTVCAWGTDGSLRNRAAAVLDQLQQYGLTDKLRCLGTTKGGHPKHPLYLAADTPLVPFGGVRA